MIDWFIYTIVAVGVALDYRFWRLRHARLKPAMARILYALLALTALLPLVVLLIGKLRSDNTPCDLLAHNWPLLVFLLTVPTRILLYIGWHFRHWSLRALSVVAAAGVIVLLGWGVAVGRTRLVVNHITHHSERLPEGWRGVRILQFTDLHIETLVKPEEELRRLVDTILSLKPDMILFTGDLVNVRHTELDEPLMAILERLRAPLGVYSVTGNHDVGVYIKDSIALPKEENTRLLVAKERAMGWQVLENESLRLGRSGDTITLTGIEFEPSLRNFRHDGELPEDYHFAAAYESIPDSLYNLTICHLPQLWEDICHLGYGDLTLAGHVHSMQHKLPIGRRGWSLSRLLYKRWSGRYDEAGHTLYINDGIGSVGIPARIGADPELTIITLDRGNEK